MSGHRGAWRTGLATTAALLVVGGAFGLGTGNADPGKPDPTDTGFAVGTVPSLARPHDHASHDHRASRGELVAAKAAAVGERDRGLVYDGLSAGRSGRCAGLFAIKGSGACTHGPDAPPTGYDVRRDVAPVSQWKQLTAQTAQAVPCYGNGSDGNRVQVLYIYSGTSRYQQYLPSFRSWANGMDEIYNDSAAKTGGVRHIRFVTDGGCEPTVTPVRVSGSAMNDFGVMIDELRSYGYDRTDRKYTVYADANVYCGIGEFAGDTRKTSSNYSNYGPSFARTDSGCWGAEVIGHELGHNLGAVNNNAPNTSGGAHCTDEYDVMCYSDSPYYPPMRFVCAASQESLLDCGNNDYFHTDPPAGSYLAAYWNMADSVFLSDAGGGDDPDPDPDPVGCAGFGNSQTGQLTAGGDARVPDGNYYWSGNAGTHTGCLTGPTGADFDLYLQRWNGSAWVTVADGSGSTADESVTFNGNAGYYRYWVDAYSGSGAWTMGWSAPR